MSVFSSPAYWYLLHYKLSIPKFLPAPISPMSARSLQKNKSGFQNSLSQTMSSASIRNSINNYRVQPWVHLCPLCSHLSNFKTTEPLDFLLQRNTQENSFHTSQSVTFSRKYLNIKFSGLLISSSNKAEEGTSSENVS